MTRFKLLTSWPRVNYSLTCEPNLMLFSFCFSSIQSKCSFFLFSYFTRRYNSVYRFTSMLHPSFSPYVNQTDFIFGVPSAFVVTTLPLSPVLKCCDWGNMCLPEPLAADLWGNKIASGHQIKQTENITLVWNGQNRRKEIKVLPMIILALLHPTKLSSCFWSLFFY